jgi:hypothetical protein
VGGHSWSRRFEEDLQGNVPSFIGLSFPIKYLIIIIITGKGNRRVEKIT